MLDHHPFTRTAIRYWERRRILYNLALVPPSLFSYGIAAAINNAGDEPYNLQLSYPLFLFALSALGANICYSFAYALEFIFGSDDPTSRWLRFGRTSVLVAGIVFAMLLAFLGGINIAGMEFYYELQQFMHAHHRG